MEIEAWEDILDLDGGGIWIMGEIDLDLFVRDHLTSRHSSSCASSWASWKCHVSWIRLISGTSMPFNLGRHPSF